VSTTPYWSLPPGSSATAGRTSDPAAGAGTRVLVDETQRRPGGRHLTCGDASGERARPELGTVDTDVAPVGHRHLGTWKGCLGRGGAVGGGVEEHEPDGAGPLLARLKAESEVPLRSYGSLSMNRALMAAGLVDRADRRGLP
jgi:hypothetical protein